MDKVVRVFKEAFRREDHEASGSEDEEEMTGSGGHAPPAFRPGRTGGVGLADEPAPERRERGLRFADDEDEHQGGGRRVYTVT